MKMRATCGCFSDCSSSPPGSSSQSLRDQAVAHARFVDDQPGLGRYLLQLLAKRADSDAQIFGLADVRRTPGGAQQSIMSEDSPGVLGELGEQGPFLGRQMDLPAVAADGPGEEVDGD